jgi:glutamate carboxypeptidase
MPQTIAPQVLEYVAAQQSRLTDLIEQMVTAESPSARPETHEDVRRVLKSALAEVGYASRTLGPHGGPIHLLATPLHRERGRPLQLLVGHYDTVWPIGTTRERPFTINGNTIHGPGSFDMKGGLAEAVIALQAIRDLGLQTTVTPILFVNADEEIGSRSSTRHIVRLAKIANRALVLEPALGEHGDIKTERKGIGRFTVTVFGKAAHAGLDPEGGASAILELSHVIQSLFALNDVDKGITVNVGTVDGGIQPNVIAPHSKAVVDVRVPSVSDGQEIERAIHSLQPSNPNIRLHIEGGIGRPSMESTPRNLELWRLAADRGEALGLHLKAARAGGGSDGNTTSQYTATLDGLGPVGDGAHAVHEHLLIDRTLERAALLTLLLTAPPVKH